MLETLVAVLSTALYHFGRIAVLAGQIPIRDGANVQPEVQADLFLQQTYPALYRKATHTVVKPGNKIPVGDLDVLVVTSAGDAIETALLGAGEPNPYCAGATPLGVDTSEDAQSIGIHMTFGRFRVIDLADLPVNKEFDVMCPNNPIGTVDLFMVSHHEQPSSNSEVLVHAIEARVAITSGRHSRKRAT